MQALTVPGWVIYPALMLGMSGMACAVIGTWRNLRAAILVGHLIVSAHILMYSAIAGGTWWIGLLALSFFAAAFFWTPDPHSWKRMMWLILAAPPAAVYLLTMGIWVLYILSHGP